MESLSEEVGRSFVKYLYTGELEENILKEQTLAFLELGQKYDIQELKDLAEQELLEQLDRKNMVEFVFMGDLFSAEKIFEAALKMTKGEELLPSKTVKQLNAKIIQLQKKVKTKYADIDVEQFYEEAMTRLR